MPALSNPRLPASAPVFFYTDRVDDLARFYTDVLGFPVTRSEPGHSYWLATGEVTLVLHQSERWYVDGPFDHAKDSALLWFTVDEPIREVYERLRAAGVETAGDVEYQLRGGLLVIRDLEGRRLGLTGPR